MDKADKLASEILNRILVKMDKAGMDQKKFAHELDIAQSTITDWKKGRSYAYMRPDMLVRMAAVLNTTTEYLMTGQKEPTPEDGDGKNPLDQRLNELLAHESDETKRAMIAFLESFQRS